MTILSSRIGRPSDTKPPEDVTKEFNPVQLSDETVACCIADIEAVLREAAPEVVPAESLKDRALREFQETLDEYHNGNILYPEFEKERRIWSAQYAHLGELHICCGVAEWA